ncbi:MAG: WD40 repeat domain-containing protein, partial [Acidobacteria bacterium]|nr:WD40 repeat domain-containing protein [Acidobacteriota bacterium]
MKHIPLHSFWLLLLAAAVCARADDPRLVLNTGGHTSTIWKVIFTRDGKYLISAGEDKVIRVWDVETGRLARTIQGEIGDGIEGKIYAMALSPDERYLAVGGLLVGDRANASAIRLHNFRTGAVVGTLLKGHDNIILALAFSPDGRYLVSGSGDHTARIWDLVANPIKEAYPPLRGHTKEIYAVAFSPDGKQIATGSYDYTLKLWDAAHGTLIKDLENKHSDHVSSVAFSPDGRFLFSGGDKRVLLWDAHTGEFIKELSQQGAQVLSISVSPDGSRLLSGFGEGPSYNCYVLAFPSGAIVTGFGKHDNIVRATTFSPSGKLVATAGGANFPIYLWNPENGQIAHMLAGKGQRVFAVGFAHDSQSIAFGNENDDDDDKDANQRRPLQRSIVFQTNTGYKVNLDSTPQDETAFTRANVSTGSYSLKTINDSDPNLQILRNGKVERTISRNSSSGFVHHCFSFTRDGQQVVSGAASGFLTLYEMQTGKKLREFVGHTGDVRAVAVSPDNRTLVSGSADQTIRLWDLESKEKEVKPLLSIFVAQDNEWVAWTPQGYYTASLNGDRYIGWHVNHGIDQAADYFPASQFKEQFYRPDVVNEYLRTRGNLELALKT